MISILQLGKMSHKAGRGLSKGTARKASAVRTLLLWQDTHAGAAVGLGADMPRSRPEDLPRSLVFG